MLFIIIFIRYLQLQTFSKFLLKLAINKFYKIMRIILCIFSFCNPTCMKTIISFIAPYCSCFILKKFQKVITLHPLFSLFNITAANIPSLLHNLAKFTLQKKKHCIFCIFLAKNLFVSRSLAFYADFAFKTNKNLKKYIN